MDKSAIENVAASAKSRLEMWAALIDLAQIEKMAEVGVWKGEFARHVLTTCKSVEAYFMIDPWRKLPDWNKPANVDDQAFDSIYREAMDATDFARQKRKVLRGRTLDVIDQIAEESLDFVYIDGDHTLRGITIDLLNVWGKVRLGGCVGGDDLFANIWSHSLEYEPTLVFPFVLYFAEAIGATIYALPSNQFLIEKQQSARGEYAFHDLVGWYGDPTLRRQMIAPPRRWTKLVPVPLKLTLRRLFSGNSEFGERSRLGMCDN